MNKMQQLKALAEDIGGGIYWQTTKAENTLKVFSSGWVREHNEILASIQQPKKNMHCLL